MSATPCSETSYRVRRYTRCLYGGRRRGGGEEEEGMEVYSRLSSSSPPVLPLPLSCFVFFSPCFSAAYDSSAHTLAMPHCSIMKPICVNSITTATPSFPRLWFAGSQKHVLSPRSLHFLQSFLGTSFLSAAELGATFAGTPVTSTFQKPENLLLRRARHERSRNEGE